MFCHFVLVVVQLPRPLSREKNIYQDKAKVHKSVMVFFQLLNHLLPVLISQIS